MSSISISPRVADSILVLRNLLGQRARDNDAV